MGMYNNKIMTLSETNWSNYHIYHRENLFSDFYKSSISKLFFFYYIVLYQIEMF